MNLEQEMGNVLNRVSNEVNESINRLQGSSPLVAMELSGIFITLFQNMENTLINNHYTKANYLLTLADKPVKEIYQPNKVIMQYLNFFNVTELKEPETVNFGGTWTVGDGRVFQSFVTPDIAIDFTQTMEFVFSEWKGVWSFQRANWIVKEPFSPYEYSMPLAYDTPKQKEEYDQFLAEIIDMPEHYLKRTAEDVLTEILECVGNTFSNATPVLSVVSGFSESEDPSVLSSGRTKNRLSDLINGFGRDKPYSGDVNYHFYRVVRDSYGIFLMSLEGCDDKIVVFNYGDKHAEYKDWLYFAINADGEARLLMDSSITDRNDKTATNLSVFVLEDILSNLKSLRKTMF